jgi:predicted enzyme related to lactoylglutathione lyase
MTELDKYVPGTPCWVEVTTTDAEGARTFYQKIFGWEYEIGDADTNFYTNCLLRGRRVAGLMELTPEMAAGGVPTAWTTYIATEDVHDSAARVTEAGGQVMAEPMDVMEYGKMAVAIDPTGAAIGFWESGTHTGAGIANEPGSFTWNELQTRELDKATAFYSAVAGWQTEAMPTGDGPPYLIAKIGGEQVAGIMDVSQIVPDSVPAFWLTYFKVRDADESVELVRQNGGAVMQAHVDSPQGPFGVVADPFGAVFGVISDPVA